MSTATHEAGHATIGRVLTFPCGRTTIKQDHDSLGHSIIPDPWMCLQAWEDRGKFRAFDAELHARIMTFMAGVEAEIAINGHTEGGDGDDRYQIDLMLERLHPSADMEKIERRLRAMTRMLIRRHRAKIERVTKALLAKKTLSARQLDKLVGRSIHDIPINDANLPPEFHSSPEESHP
jgi:ATP-dependent Zn protease